MSSDPASLDRLHDIVEPAPVPWWPPAPGWYVVMAIAAVVLAWLGVRRWQHWRANAYRRAALRELNDATTPTDISAVLRRTALVAAPRSTVASLTGDRWASWLAESTSANMPPQVRELLAAGVYQQSAGSGNVSLLKEYAQTWIEQHSSNYRELR